MKKSFFFKFLQKKFKKSRKIKIAPKKSTKDKKKYQKSPKQVPKIPKKSEKVTIQYNTIQFFNVSYSP